jgi:lysophospholipase L1-like esterase
MDISSKFLAKDGSLSREIMFDGVHPAEAGYTIWGKALLAAGIMK